MTDLEARSAATAEPHKICASDIIFEKASRQDLAEALEHVEHGLYFFRTGRRAHALVVFRQATLIAPGSALTHYIYGIGLKAAGRAGEAVEEWQKALRTTCDDSDDVWARQRAAKMLQVFRERLRDQSV